ncbi:hypothetical protein ACIQ64_30675 [Streptomyces sp. NPDC094473]|uniref:hypothetical protein n=1 Tax=unclassified Streptomyces TaxID=2593676 RepID=UPI0037F895BF
MSVDSLSENPPAATDGSNYRQVPIDVVVPHDVEAGAEAVAVCARFGVPVLSWGGERRLAGQCAKSAVVIDRTNYCCGCPTALHPVPDVRRIAAQRRPVDWEPPKLARSAVVRTCCRHHAVTKYHADRELIRRTHIDAEVLDEACRRLVGNFGFERGHYEPSMTVGEQCILPAVRGTAPSSMVLAAGFSCRTHRLSRPAPVAEPCIWPSLWLSAWSVSCRPTIRRKAPTGRPLTVATHACSRRHSDGRNRVHTSAPKNSRVMPGGATSSRKDLFRAEARNNGSADTQPVETRREETPCR